MGFAGGDLDLYSYVGGTPTEKVNPSGNQIICPFFEPGCIQKQHLSDCAKNVLQPHFPGLNLNDVVISPGLPGFATLAPGFEAGAITLNGTIFYQPGFFSGDAGGLSLIGHELTHVQQQNSGMLPFLANYLSDYVQHLVNGNDTAGTYENIGAEKSRCCDGKQDIRRSL
jgi:hypothetical protein